MSQHFRRFFSLFLTLAIGVSARRSAFAQSHARADHAPGGAVISEGRGGGEDQTRYVARVIDRGTLAPRGAGSELFLRDVPYGIGMGPALAALANGQLTSVYCSCFGGSANTACFRIDLNPPQARAELRPRTRQSGVCPTGAIAATNVGSELLVVSPFPDGDGIHRRITHVTSEGYACPPCYDESSVHVFTR